MVTAVAKAAAVVAVVAAVGMAVVMSDFWTSILWPYGPAVEVPVQDRPVYGKVDPSNKSLRESSGKLRKIYERVENGQRLMNGPETVLFDHEGTLYAITEDAKLVSLTDFQEESAVKTTAKTTVVADLGNGRPLGGAFTKDGTLYFADPLIGLGRVQFGADNKRPRVEIVATTVTLNDGTLSKILFADDVDIGPKTGHVYFSDATDITPTRMIHEMSWDVLYASKLDFSRGKRRGRLLRYDPQTDQVDVLATGLWFANGIAVDQDETFVMVSETFAVRQMMYHLTGPKAGTIEPLLSSSLSTPDGAACTKRHGNNDSDSDKTPYCYAVLPSAKLPIVTLLFDVLPPFVERQLRTFILTLLPQFMPSTKPYGAVIEIDPSTRTITRLFQDPNGQDIKLLTGVTEFQGKLYLGSLYNDFIGVYDLR